MAINFDVTRSVDYGKTVNAYHRGMETKPQDRVKKADEIKGKDYGEGTLSVKAQELLKRLRDTYGDYDFFVGDSQEALDELSRGSNKAVSIMFSAEDLEKMAEDEAYAETRISEMENAAKEILDFMDDYNNSDESKESGTVIKRVAVTVNADGTTSVFAELAKVNEAQRERIEKAREEKSEAAKEAKETKAEKEQEKQAGKKEPIRTVQVQAESLEELRELIRNFDWTALGRVDEAVKGKHFDFSV